MHTGVKALLTVCCFLGAGGVLLVEGQGSGTVAAGSGIHSFARDFAPTEGLIKAQERPYRDGVCLNGSWKFMPVEVGAGKPGAGNPLVDTQGLMHPEIPADPLWESVPVKVPSPWNVNSFAGGGSGRDGGSGRGGDFVTYPSYPKKWEKVRAGWLMRKLPYKAAWKGKRLILHFDAVAGYAVIFVNKKEAGRHFDIFLPFDLDITDKINRNGDNELLIWVADAALFNEPGKYGRRIYVGGSFWGQHIIGIWQDSWLSVKPPVYIANTFIEPFVGRDELRVEATLRNESDATGQWRVSGKVLPWVDLAGTTVLDAPEPKWKLGDPALGIEGPLVRIAPHTEMKVTLTIRVKGRLALWSPGHPHLYAMLIGLADAKGTMDRQYNRFGWREFRIAGNQFDLNGEPIVLKGDSWHFMGIPQMTRRYAWAWFTMLKNAGANAVRLHAEPYPACYLDMADEMGMMVLDETGLWASDGGPKIDGDAYWQNAEDHLRNFIIRDRNHPSVLGWSVCNENIPVAVNVWHAPEPLVQKQLSEINRWVATARELDPSRNWISGDGETGRPTELPTIIGHYGDERAYKDWSSQGKVWGIGESGMAYYGTPRQSAAYNGDESYVSQEGRMKGVAEEATRILNLQKKYRASYRSVFNLVWYGLKPLEFGLSDTGRAPDPADGIFFKPYGEGEPGVQPERLGPYTSTLNPGYDPGLPLYRTWPLFDAIRAGFSDTGMVQEHWPGAVGGDREHSGGGGGNGVATVKEDAVKNGNEGAKERVGKNGQGNAAGRAIFSAVTLLSADKDSVLCSVLRDMGIAVSEDRRVDSSRLVVIDGNYPPADDSSLSVAGSVMRGGGTIFLLGARPSAVSVINRYLPEPVTLTDRKASSFIVVAGAGEAVEPGAGDESGGGAVKVGGMGRAAILNGLGNADFYFSELSRLPLASYGLSGDFVRMGKSLLTACNTDWNSWNNQPEYQKTVSVIRSEREAKPRGDVLVGTDFGKGRLYFMTLDPSMLYKTSENVLHRLFLNLGMIFPGGSWENPKGNPEAVDEAGVVRNAQVLGAADGTHILRSSGEGVFDVEAGASGVAYISFWLYSPRSLVNLLAEPDMPVLDLQVTDEGEGGSDAAGKEGGKKDGNEGGKKDGKNANKEAVRLFLNGKPVGNKALPMEKGWNHFSIRISQPGRQKLRMKFESGSEDFLREIRSRALPE